MISREEERGRMRRGALKQARYVKEEGRTSELKGKRTVGQASEIEK